MRENGGFTNYSMIEIEKYPCRDENEASARERHWFEILNSGLNTNYPQRSSQEYKADHKEEILIQQRQHYADNRDKISIQKRQYYTDNKEKKVIQQRQHYADNRGEIAIQRKQTFICECGKTSTWCNKTRHLNSKIHKQYMECVMLATAPITTIDDDVENQLVRGICYIKLDQEEFENIKQHKEINDDHFYSSNHYDYMYQH
jgi:mannitol-specific phosphotransferase system IIBC component